MTDSNAPSPTDAPTDTAHGPIDYASTAAAAHPSAVAIGVVGLRLLGIHWLMSVITTLPYLLLQLWQGSSPAVYGGDNDQMAWMIGSISTYLISALTLIIFAKPIASFAFAGRPQAEPIAAGPLTWLTIAVAAVGMAFVVFSLESGITGIVALSSRILANVRQSVPTPIEPYELFMLLVPIAKIGLGLALLLRPRWIVGQWMRHVRL